MKRVALLGHPVGHSVSPAFQNAAFRHLGIDARYEGVDVLTDELPAVVGTLRDSTWLGANVTVPHKQAVFRLVDEVDDLASRVGAVNTVGNRDGRLFATNTDVTGFLQSIEAAGIVPDGADCLVLGAGGSARAVAYGLLSRGARLSIASRSPDRSAALTASLRGATAFSRIRTVPWDARLLRDVARASRIVVNCTPIGMLHGPNEDGSPLPDGSLTQTQFVADIVYNPPETPLLLQARAAGAAAIGGIEMLVRQGAASFEFWTGRRAPVDVMREAARRALYGGEP